MSVARLSTVAQTSKDNAGMTDPSANIQCSNTTCWPTLHAHGLARRTHMKSRTGEQCHATSRPARVMKKRYYTQRKSTKKKINSSNTDIAAANTTNFFVLAKNIQQCSLDGSDVEFAGLLLREGGLQHHTRVIPVAHQLAMSVPTLQRKSTHANQLKIHRGVDQK